MESQITETVSTFFSSKPDLAARRLPHRSNRLPSRPPAMQQVILSFYPCFRPSSIEPWSIIGNETLIYVSTDRTSCFACNKIALRMEVLCDQAGSNSCPASGVGVYNPGYWGMNIEQGKSYRVVLYVKSSNSSNLLVSLTSSDGSRSLASHSIIASASEVSDWKKMKFQLESKESNRNSGLKLTTNQ